MFLQWFFIIFIIQTLVRILLVYLDDAHLSDLRVFNALFCFLTEIVELF